MTKVTGELRPGVELEDGLVVDLQRDVSGYERMRQRDIRQVEGIANGVVANRAWEGSVVVY
jgi:hypothetical protein